MKTLFYGTPEISVPYLELLARRTQVVGVVSQPDKPAGRALKVGPTPIKRKALELGLPVHQPVKPTALAPELKALAPDLAVAVAYGRLLRPEMLAVPRHGTLNVHFSLLPRYRGAAPVQWSLVRGESRTGVTVFWLDEGMDTGAIFMTRETEVGPDEDALQLMAKLQSIGLAALDEALSLIERGETRRIAQSGEPSLAPLIKKEDAKISLLRPAQEIHNLVRGFRSWPKGYLELRGGQRLIVLKTKLHDAAGEGPAGRITAIEPDGSILVQCGFGSRLWFLAVQSEGKKPVNAADFINGLRMAAGDVLPIVL